jgi:GrpB-like predicted nucleotidyltransferase (UPF0157 family)
MVSLSEAISNKYVFTPYSRTYLKKFRKEKNFLSKVLASIKTKEIHHIGSTSVPNLGGKKIIDIIVVVDKKNISKAKSLLIKGGFVYHHTMRRKRSFYYKYYLDSSKKPNLVHLHLTYFGSGELDKALAFRNYLRAFPTVRKQYELIKKRASKLHSKDGPKYVAFKLHFVEEIMDKAMGCRKILAKRASASKLVTKRNCAPFRARSNKVSPKSRRTFRVK